MNSSFMNVNDEGQASGPPLADLSVFVAVAEAEGFSAAARRLRVSKAMVSTAVSRLEARLQVRLFQRTTRRLSLTEAGAAALPHAQRALLAAKDAEEAATQARTSPRGTLRLTAPMSFGLLHLAPALGAFAKQYPELRVDLVLDDRFVDLVEGGFDLAIRIGDLPDSSLIAQRLGRNRSVLVAHAAYLKAAGPPKEPDDLLQHSALVYSVPGTGDRWKLERDGRNVSVRVGSLLQVNSSLALREAALQGLGIARIPLFVVGEDLARKRLVRVLPRWNFSEQGIYAVTTARQYQPRKTRAFIEFLRERIGDPPSWEKAARRPGTRA